MRRVFFPSPSGSAKKRVREEEEKPGAVQNHPTGPEARALLFYVVVVVAAVYSRGESTVT